jgi:hypothetical protein
MKAQPPLSVPVSDLGKPLAARQFPYRPATPAQIGPERAAQEQREVNANVSLILSGTEDLLYSIAWKMLGKYVTTAADVDDVVQKCRVWLWKYALPRYDAHRIPRVKPSTFIFFTVNRWMMGESRTIRRRWDHPQHRSGTSPDRHHAGGADALAAIIAPDCSLDRAIEAVAADVRACPEKYLTHIQCRVFKAVQASPKITMTALARELGYHQLSSLCIIVKRIHQRIRDIDIEEASLRLEDLKT